MNTLNTALPANIQVYSLDLSSAVCNSNLLDAAEQARAARFKQAVHRERFIAAHCGLREMLMRHVNENPVICHAVQGKPYLRDYPEIHFNLSHSGNMALYAISLHTPVGIDVEAQRDSLNVLDIAKRFFSPEEYHQLKAAEYPEPLFLQLWTRKEAYLKLKGTGIARGLDRQIPEDIMIHDFNFMLGYTGALAFKPL